jgi:hypothetical protein
MGLFAAMILLSLVPLATAITALFLPNISRSETSTPAAPRVRAFATKG